MSHKTDTTWYGIGELLFSVGSCITTLLVLYRIVKKRDARSDPEAFTFHKLMASIMLVNGVAYSVWLSMSVLGGRVAHGSSKETLPQTTKCSVLGFLAVLKGISLQYIWMFLAVETFFIITKKHILNRGMKFCLSTVAMSTVQIVVLGLRIGFGRGRTGCFLRVERPGGALLPSERAQYYVATIILFSVACAVQGFNLWHLSVTIGKQASVVSVRKRRAMVIRMAFLPAGIVLVHLPQIFNYGFFPSLASPGMSLARNHFLRLQPFISAMVLFLINRKLCTGLKECCEFRKGGEEWSDDTTEENIRLATLLAPDSFRDGGGGEELG